ncbi:unnamed protein product [Protopolystoma xenopodis]|uniref:Uncharacterized protein n=1 Tax=Protopolystoma xenopodis TaxID=117903 RepID=A0A448XG12_9PLAT|nr:unnamed protein product [Protopolystoma xenopodis]
MDAQQLPSDLLAGLPEYTSREEQIVYQTPVRHLHPSLGHSTAVEPTYDLMPSGSLACSLDNSGSLFPGFVGPYVRGPALAHGATLGPQLIQFTSPATLRVRASPCGGLPGVRSPSRAGSGPHLLPVTVISSGLIPDGVGAATPRYAQAGDPALASVSTRTSTVSGPGKSGDGGATVCNGREAAADHFPWPPPLQAARQPGRKTSAATAVPTRTGPMAASVNSVFGGREQAGGDGGEGIGYSTTSGVYQTIDPLLLVQWRTAANGTSTGCRGRVQFHREGRAVETELERSSNHRCSEAKRKKVGTRKSDRSETGLKREGDSDSEVEEEDEEVGTMIESGDEERTESAKESQRNPYFQTSFV